MRRTAIVLTLAAALLASSCGDGRNSAGPSPSPIVAASPASFQRALRSLRGKAGKPVVVNFWATWCDPCKTEMPRLVSAARHYSGRVGFLGVDVQDDSGAAALFAQRLEVPYRSIGDPRREIVRGQNILGLPVTQFYSSDGELAFVHQGEIKAADLSDQIEQLIAVGHPASAPGD